MIVTIRHKGLEAFFQDGQTKGLPQKLIKRLKSVLTLLDQIADVNELKVPYLRLHQLKGDLKGFWSVTISGNWRLVFRFEKEEVLDLDLVDYH